MNAVVFTSGPELDATLRAGWPENTQDLTR